MGKGGGGHDGSEHSTRLLDELTQPGVPPRHTTADGFPAWLDHNRYRRETRLGRGGMGLVYSYRDPKLDRLVAVKAMPEEWADQPRARERFVREARMLAAIDHPNIARVHHLAEEDGRDYLILEYIAGRTLMRVLDGRPMSLERCLGIARQVARAIEAGHAIDVIHRDVKPSNIMITPGDVAKLLDYGIARHVRPDIEVTGAPATSPGAVERGAVLGTIGYMSPEQASGLPVDHRTDVWAFGCVLYEMLSGRPALPGRTREERLAATFAAAPDFVALPADLPESVRSTVVGCLRRDPADRMGDMGDVCVALDRAFDEQSGAVGTALPRNLPRPLTAYIERDGEIEKVRGLLLNHRLVTLAGPGGSGKTRLSIATGQAMLADADGRPPTPTAGVWFAELGDLADDQLVSHAVASVVLRGLGAELSVTDSSLDALVAAVRDARMLLVLDNCENLVAGCRDFVIELLMRCPEIRVLATSREALGVPGEQAYRVPALTYPADGESRDLDRFESIRLFLARARLAMPDFALGAANAAPIAAICRRLEGVPLAVELAAARVSVVPVEDIARRLMDLVAGQPVLEASIASSVDTLDAAERTLLRRLAVFRGGWTLEAAEQVCGDDGSGVKHRPVIDLLSRLVSRSLVLYEMRADRARYHLLETVRDYCRRHLLRPKEADAVARRHHAFYLALADEADAAFDGEEQGAWLDRLEVEHDNFRAVLEAARDGGRPDELGRLARNLNTFWAIHGHVVEGSAWLEHAIAARADVADVLQIQLENALGIVCDRKNDLPAARRAYTRALEIARALGDERRTAGILTNLGLLIEEEGNLAESRRCHEQSIAIYEQLGEAVGVAMARLNLGVVAKSEERYDEAVALFRQCLPLFREAGDHQRVAALLRNLGEILLVRDEVGRALEHLRESLEISRELGDRKYVGHTLILLAVLSTKMKRWDEAAHLLGAADALLEQVQAPVPFSFRKHDEAARLAIRAGLDRDAEVRARSEGGSMNCDQATDYAIHLYSEG